MPPDRAPRRRRRSRACSGLARACAARRAPARRRARRRRERARARRHPPCASRASGRRGRCRPSRIAEQRQRAQQRVNVARGAVHRVREPDAPSVSSCSQSSTGACGHARDRASGRATPPRVRRQLGERTAHRGKLGLERGLERGEARVVVRRRTRLDAGRQRWSRRRVVVGSCEEERRRASEDERHSARRKPDPHGFLRRVEAWQRSQGAGCHDLSPYCSNVSYWAIPDRPLTDFGGIRQLRK